MVKMLFFLNCLKNKVRLIIRSVIVRKIQYQLVELKQKFYPGLGLEPRPLALHASVLTNTLSTTSTGPQ